MISTMILYWIAMAGMFASFAYSKGWILADFESINAKKAITLLENENNITILDVRTLKEYSNQHLLNAKHIPVQKLTENLSMLKDDKNKCIIVYCRSGNRSIKASRILEENGFTPLNVEGGIIELMRNNAKLAR